MAKTQPTGLKPGVKTYIKNKALALCQWLILFITLSLLSPFCLLAESNYEINSVSSNFVSVVNRKTENSTTIAIYGNNFSSLIHDENIDIYLGDFKGLNVSGNNEEINATFYFYNQEVTENYYNFKIINSETSEILYESDLEIEFFNPYKNKYIKPHLKKFFKKTKTKKPSKRNIGLNTHQTMASTTSTDNVYKKKLTNSKTKWVREQFSHQLIMNASKTSWVTRYDKTMKQYKNNNIRVVGMLAYDKNQNYTNPSLNEWKKYVRYTVRRYRNYVDVWEIWNEPDLSKYLNPSNIETYQPLLKSGYKIIKKYDPNSTVLNGGIANIANLDFIENLYQKGRKYFDAFNIHLYYCDSYQQSNNIDLMKNELADLEKVIFKNKRNKKVWVTEIGCSTYNINFNQNTQRDYLKKSVNHLLKTGYVENILLYTMRDRDLSDAYEKYFGLMDLDFKNKKSWRWYRRLRAN